MNSISYLDSVLSRSFSTDRRSSSSKRSQSHSSLPGSRRPSKSAFSTPGATTPNRRFSQERDSEPESHARSATSPTSASYYPYSAKLRRTGSTPAHVYASTVQYDDTDSDRDVGSAPRARWSALWGLTGWIDEAINPANSSSSGRSRKNSNATPPKRTRRVPSLDELLLGSTAPARQQARRTASSGSGRGLRYDDGFSNHYQQDSHGLQRTASARRRRMLSQLAGLTMTGSEHQQNDERDMMSEKEREDIVDFEGGDFSQEEYGPATLAQSLHARTESQESQFGGSSSSENSVIEKLLPVASEDDEEEEEKKEGQTLINEKAIKEAPASDMAQEEPGDTLVEAEDVIAERTASPPVLGTLSPPPHTDDDNLTSGTVTPSISRRGSRKGSFSSTVSPIEHLSDFESSAPSTFSSTTSDESTNRAVARRRRSGRSSSASTEVLETGSNSSGWLAPRPNPSRSGSAIGAGPTRRRRFSPTRAFRKALLALRDAILAILLCPFRCVQALSGKRKRQTAMDSLARDVPVLLHQQSDAVSLAGSEDEGKFSEKEEAAPGRKRPPSLRPQVGQDDPFISKVEPEEDDDEEPITEEQAIARAERLRRRTSEKREEPRAMIKSRLLPNPNPIDPLLAHDRNAQPIDEKMACEEARIAAERDAKVAARRAARHGLPQPAVKASFVPSVPRGPSSIIPHSPKILVLDLDETLIHSTSRSPTYHLSSGRRSGMLGIESLGAVLGLRANENPGRIRPHMVEVVLDGRSVIYHVYKRPWVDYFLRKVAAWYHVVIFTASVQEYADPVIDWLDQGRGLISGRLFREACTYKDGTYVKNLQVVDRDLSTVCLVDNSPASYAINQANGIPVEGWTHDPNDEALLDLLPILDSLRFATDVRHILGIRGFSSSLF